MSDSHFRRWTNPPSFAPVPRKRVTPQTSKWKPGKGGRPPKFLTENKAAASPAPPVETSPLPAPVPAGDEQSEEIENPLRGAAPSDAVSPLSPPVNVPPWQDP